MRPPFPWPCNQRSLPQHGNQIMAMSCCQVPMNIMGWLVMRPPILLARSCFIIFLWVPLVSYRESFYCLLGDPWVRHLQVLFPMDFIFCQLLLPHEPLATSSHKTRCTLEGHPNGQTRVNGMDERDIRWKSDKMVGADDASANPPWWLTKTHEYQLAKLPHQSPQQWSSGLV